MVNSSRFGKQQCVKISRQSGALTMFSAVLILILLTGLVIYATQVGVFEQRKSANELRQKQAFHSAELGIQRGQEFLLSNVLDMTLQTPGSGWLDETNVADGGTGRWVPCEENYSENDGPHSFWHPCYGEALDGEQGELNLRDDSYFYSVNGETPTPLPMPIQDGGELLDRTTETSEVYALLCMLDVNPAMEQPVQRCLGDDERAFFDRVYFVVTLLSRGRSECADGGDCRGEALIAQRLGSYGPVPGTGGPGVPLTSKTSLHPTGTVEIVPNPNGGGLGVPVSVWLDGEFAGYDPDTGEEIYHSICVDGDEVIAVERGSNSWATCEMHEWYEVEEVDIPEHLACPADPDSPSVTPCSCDASEQIVSHGNHGDVRYDIVVDPDFPCDLFQYVFNTTVVSDAKARFTPITDCNELGPDSAGPIWLTLPKGQKCSVTSTVIGSPEHPVFLVASVDELSLGGGSVFYGVVMTTDAEGRDGLFNGSGGGLGVGAAMVDGELEPNFNSNFTIIWNDDLVGTATKLGSLGKLYGGWTDFHEDWR